MTRKDYELIAKAVRNTRAFIENGDHGLSTKSAGLCQLAINELVYRLASDLQDESDKFNYLRFIEKTETLVYQNIV